MPTIAFATDVHRDARIFDWLEMALRSCDVVAIGGDLDAPVAKLAHPLTFLVHELRPHYVRDRILDMNERPGSKQILVVLGNHDGPDPRALHGRSVTTNGITVGGVGGSLPGGSFPFELEEREYERILKGLGHVDVLVSHEPPYDTRCDIAYGGRHVGSKSIREYVLLEGPRLVLTGHVHESGAVDRLGSSTIVNPGAFANGKYAVAEVREGDVQVHLRDLDGNA